MNYPHAGDLLGSALTRCKWLRSSLIPMRSREKSRRRFWKCVKHTRPDLDHQFRFKCITHIILRELAQWLNYDSFHIFFKRNSRHLAHLFSLEYHSDTNWFQSIHTLKSVGVLFKIKKENHWICVWEHCDGLHECNWLMLLLLLRKKLSSNFVGNFKCSNYIDYSSQHF